MKKQDLGPGACLTEAQLVDFARFFSEKENGEENYRLLEVKSRDFQGEWSRSQTPHDSNLSESTRYYWATISVIVIEILFIVLRVTTEI